MKNIVSLLALVTGYAVCTTAMTQVSELSEFSNSKAYTLSRQDTTDIGLVNFIAENGNVKVGGSADATSDNALWAIHYSEREKAYYLYNLAAKQFVTGNSDNQAIFTTDAIDVIPIYLPTTAIDTSAGYWMLDCGGYMLGMNSDKYGTTIYTDDLNSANVKAAAFSFVIDESTTRTISNDENIEIENLIKNGRSSIIASYHDFINKAKDFDKDGLSNYAGSYNVTALENALNNADNYTLSELEQIYRTVLMSKYPQPRKYYRLRNYSRPTSDSKDNVLSLTTSNTLKARSLSSPQMGSAASGYQEDLAIMQFEYTGADFTQAHIRVCATGQYLSSCSNGVAVSLTEKSGAYTYTITPVDTYSRLFTLDDPTNNMWLTISGAHQLVGYNTQEDPEKWYFEEVTSISVVPDDNGYLVLVLPASVTMPEGCTAYNIVGEYEDELYAEPITSYVPAGTPFLLKSSSGSAAVELPTYTGSTSSLTSVLTGTNVATSAPDRHTFVSAADDVLSFISTAAESVKPNTAYYQTEKIAGIPITFKDYPFSGINEIKVSDINADDMYFDLQGRRVMKPSKGLYINGTTRKTVLIR